MPAGEYPNSFSTIQAFGLEFSQTEYICAWQALQNPQAIGKGTTTRSPALSVVTAPPTSTTSPMNSCPSTSPLFSVGTKPPYRCRSEPQIAVEVILTMASRSFKIVGSGTSWTWTLPRCIQQLALIVASLSAVHGIAVRDRFGHTNAASMPLTFL